MPEASSWQVITQQDTSTGVGITVATADETGIKVNSPAHMRRDSTIYHPVMVRCVDLIATAVDRQVFPVARGIWELTAVAYCNRVVGSDGSAVTADIMACASGTAPASGTTCLATADTINLKSTADTVIQVAVATTRPQVGPGGAFSLNVTGTLTAVVSTITCEFTRVA